MRQGFTGTLARHLQQTQLRKTTRHGFDAVSGQLFLELSQHRILVLGAAHVDEINDHNPTQIAQAQLSRNRLSCFEVGFENRVVKIASAHIATCVHIDGGQGLSLVHDQITA